MRFIANRCEVVHVAKSRLLLGTRQMATRTYDVSRREGLFRSPRKFTPVAGGNQ